MIDDYSNRKSQVMSLHRSMFILQQKADDLLTREAGVGLSQVRIMSQLHSSVPRSQRTVASMLHQTEANVSRQLQLMRRRGLVNINRNKNDRRVREVTLTAKGSATYQRAETELNEQLRNLKAIAKSDISDLTRILDSLALLA